MRKVLQILAAAIVSVAFIGSAAGAVEIDQPNCDSIVITNTGANSNNEGVCTVNTSVNVTCNGTIYVLDSNTQDAVTGQASSVGNTSSGPAISGNATNENNQSVAIGSPCATTTNSETPVSPSPSPSVTPTATTKKASVLPYTAGTSTATIIAASIVAAAAVVALSRIAVAAYRRYSIK